MSYYSFTVKAKKSKVALALVILLLIGGVVLEAALAPRVLAVIDSNKDLVADVLVASIAHAKAGPPVHFDVDYSHSATADYWGVEANSKWLADYTNLIVPILVYEKASAGSGRYPKVVAFIPYSGERSQHVGGSMAPFFSAVIINERYVNDVFWNDRRETLATLVHELIHAQGGTFLSGSSASLEANTAAATVEVLAAMCNLGDRLACGAFWHNLEFLARNDLRAQLNKMGKEGVYLWLSGLLWNDEAEQRHSMKKARYWKENSDEQADILYKYYEIPWRELVIPLVLDKHGRLNTDIVDGRVVVGMPFDDTREMLGWMRALLKVVVE